MEWEDILLKLHLKKKVSDIFSSEYAKEIFWSDVKHELQSVYHDSDRGFGFMEKIGDFTRKVKTSVTRFDTPLSKESLKMGKGMDLTLLDSSESNFDPGSPYSSGSIGAGYRANHNMRRFK